jgi:hypothetical protein
MNKLIPLAISILTANFAFGQLPEDALRNSWFMPNGSARTMAVGGVMGSLGGDITANHINPAGLGLYRTSEFVISPGFLLNRNKFNYRDSNSTVNKNVFNYGTSGFVFGGGSERAYNKHSGAFAISVNQSASFNNRTQYKGFNNKSSFSEQFLEELVRDKADTNAALGNYIFGSTLAFRTYLIDTSNNSAGVFNGYQSLVTIGTGVNQYKDEKTSGGYHEIALGFGKGVDDKLYLGASVAIPISSFTRDLYYKESDATNNTGNDFNYFEFREKTTSLGVGIGLKGGLIYKPKEYIRLGLAIHTPQLMSFKDKVTASLTTDTEGYAGKLTETSDNLNSGNAGERSYNLITPARVIASASYVFREVANTKRQRAFLSADVEFVNYHGARFAQSDDEDFAGDDYYDAVNSAVKAAYKNNFNVRVGGELKFDPFMFRLGAAYYGSPYKDEQLKASRLVTTAGIGIRTHGVFVDLAYTHMSNKDFNFPYRLNDKANTYAEQTGSKGSVMLTVGFKL